MELDKEHKTSDLQPQSSKTNIMMANKTIFTSSVVAHLGVSSGKISIQTHDSHLGTGTLPTGLADLTITGGKIYFSAWWRVKSDTNRIVVVSTPDALTIAILANQETLGLFVGPGTDQIVTLQGPFSWTQLATSETHVDAIAHDAAVKSPSLPPQVSAANYFKYSVTAGLTMSTTMKEPNDNLTIRINDGHTGSGQAWTVLEDLDIQGGEFWFNSWDDITSAYNSNEFTYIATPDVLTITFLVNQKEPVALFVGPQTDQMVAIVGGFGWKSTD